jgi:hypothetical protein
MSEHPEDEVLYDKGTQFDRDNCDWRGMGGCFPLQRGETCCRCGGRGPAPIPESDPRWAAARKAATEKLAVENHWRAWGARMSDQLSGGGSPPTDKAFVWDARTGGTLAEALNRGPGRREQGVDATRAKVQAGEMPTMEEVVNLLHSYDDKCHAIAALRARPSEPGTTAADPRISEVAQWIAGKAPVFWYGMEAAELMDKLKALRDSR